jgi:N utilization substance protein A
LAHALNKRCPNAALPGSHYCGVPAHQALANLPVPVAVAAEPTLADVEGAIEGAAADVAAEDMAAAAVLVDAVEEAVVAGEISVEDAALIENAIEEAAAEAVAEDITAAVALEEILEEAAAEEQAVEGDERADA